MRELPVGVQDFPMIRQCDMVYVDKTGQLVSLIATGRRYFLARPRRFGKSLTVSTLAAMFSGRAELFRGLRAESFVASYKDAPHPVLILDFSSFGTPKTTGDVHAALNAALMDCAQEYAVSCECDECAAVTLKNLLKILAAERRSVVVLVDEYDKFLLDALDDMKQLDMVRNILRNFYITLKSCDRYLRFVFISGISKFSKVGIFSGMNNLLDISMNRKFADIVGYTQEELELNFGEYIHEIAERNKCSREEILYQLKAYYDGFSFDGSVRVYNPFSIVSFFATGEFNKFWYESGSPSFIVYWMKNHKIEEMDQYRNVEVDVDFTSSHDVENTSTLSFLYQTGYLTIVKRDGDLLTLDYPNKEVLDALSKRYLELIYHIDKYPSLGSAMWCALEENNIHEIVKLYNTAISEVPYEDFSKRDEYWYRSIFLMLLRGASIIVYAEVHTVKGRSDACIQWKNRQYVFEFKYAKDSSFVARKRGEGISQMRERSYAVGYGKSSVAVLFVIDGKKREIADMVVVSG